MGIGTNTGTGAPVGRTTAQLQCPTSPGDVSCTPGVYHNWDAAIWGFGTTYQYPALTFDTLIIRDNDLDGLRDDQDPAAYLGSRAGAVG